MVENISEALSITLPSDREIKMTRVFNAPRHLVFDAMTMPEHVAQWWGCSGSTLSVCEIDFRPGGAWRYVLRMKDQDFKFKGVYHEIDRPGRIVATECYDEPSIGSPEWLSTITLEDLDGKTLMTSLILHASREARDGHLQSGMEHGAGQTFDRLAEHLKSMS